MKLYYSPGACSLASHIALHEGGAQFELVKVDLRAKTTEDGEDFTKINPKGYVPALGLDEGGVLTENIAVLSYMANETGALMPEGMARWRVLEMAAFVSTELHKNFKPFFNPASGEADKDAARDILTKRFALAADLLGDREFVVGDEMSIADCYMFVVLMWAIRKVKLDLPARLTTYYERLAQRPAVKQALEHEGLA